MQVVGRLQSDVSEDGFLLRASKGSLVFQAHCQCLSSAQGSPFPCVLFEDSVYGCRNKGMK